MKRLQKLIIPLLVIVMLSGCGVRQAGPTVDESAQEIESVQAETMRLVSIDGTVSLTDDEGQPIPSKEDMRLFSGNSVITEIQSKAGISLDEVKAATIGEESTAKLHQEGKQLSLDLEKGKLYFSVAEPLTDDESFEINTSTMTLGIRGTSGYVETIDENTGSVILTSGELHIKFRTKYSTTIRAGQRLDVTIEGEKPVFHVNPIDYKDYPELLLECLLQEPDILQEVIDQNELFNGDLDAAQKAFQEALEAAELPTDGDRIVLQGTINTYTHDQVVELQGFPDPNPANDDPYNYRVIVLDEPQTILAKAGDGSGYYESTTRLIRVGMMGPYDASMADIPMELDGQHIVFSIDSETTHWASDTSLPMGAARTIDVHILK